MTISSPLKLIFSSHQMKLAKTKCAWWNGAAVWRQCLWGCQWVNLEAEILKHKRYTASVVSHRWVQVCHTLEGTTNPSGPSCIPPSSVNIGDEIFVHFHSSNHVNLSSFSQTKHAQSTVSFFFPALWMLKQQFCAKGTGGFYAPAGPHGRDSHNKGLQVFPISLWLFLSNSICWNASCLLLKKAQCLAMQGACLSFNCPHTLNILCYLDRPGAQWEPLTSKTSLQSGRLWRGKGDPEMW